jgi:hypothetical protein
MGGDGGGDAARSSGLGLDGQGGPRACRVYSRLSEESDGQDRRRETGGGVNYGHVLRIPTCLGTPPAGGGGVITGALLSKHSGETVVGRSRSSSA